MSNITQKTIDSNHYQLLVTVDPSDYLPNFEKQLKTYSKQANVPGFRKGMLPMGMVKKMYGKQVFVQEVFGLVQQNINQYLEKEKLTILGQPVMDETMPINLAFESPASYTFSFEIGTRPEVIWPEFTQSGLLRYEIEVEDKMMNEEIDKLRKKHGKLMENEAILDEDNIIHIDFKELDAHHQIVEGGVQVNNVLVVKYFHPSIRSKWMGVKLNEALIFNIQDAFEDKEREWVMKDLGLENTEEYAAKFFSMSITRIAAIQPTDMNADFFKLVFPEQEITTEEAFRERMKEQAAHYLRNESTNYLHHELYHYLIENSVCKLPEIFLKKWFAQTGETKKTNEEVEEQWPAFASELKYTILIDTLVQKYKVEITNRDLQAAVVNEIINYYGASSMQQGEVKKLLGELMRNEEYMQRTTQHLKQGKVFNALEPEMNLRSQSISQIDFNEKVKAHHHHLHP